MESSEGYTEVFAWGANRHGQLGLGTKQVGRCYCIPRFCTFNVIIRRVACGEEHSAFITDNGSIYTMGSNAEGRLGIGDRTMKISVTPCLVEALSKFNAVEIACGWGHTVAVLDNGNVYSWGVGEYGALGTIEAKTQWFPVQMQFSERPFIKAVSCGTRHTGMIDSEGRLFVCGAGDAGQLGINSRKSCLQPIHLNLNTPILQAACGIFHTVLLTIEGTVFAMGGNNFGQLGTGTRRSSSTPQLVKGLERITKVAAGRTSAALDDKGVVYIWGGEHLVPNALNEIEGIIVDIELGGNFAGAIDTEGDLYTWGENKSGELGAGDYKPRTRPTHFPSIKGKQLIAISCGGAYAIALGRNTTNAFPLSYRSPLKSKSPLQEDIKTIPKRSAENFYRNDVKSVARERRQPLTSVMSHDDEYDELIEAYKNEQQRCQQLVQRIEKVKESILNNEKRSTIKIDTTLQNQLSRLELQLQEEQERSTNNLKDLEARRDKISNSYSEVVGMECKVQELTEIIKEIKQENNKLIEDKDKSIGARLSELLQEYENRIEKEIEDRRRIVKEKASEINDLYNEITKLENAVTETQNNKAKLVNEYLEEIKNLEEQINEAINKLELKVRDKEESMNLNKENETAYDIVENDIRKTEGSIKLIEHEIKKLLEKLEYEKQKVKDKEKEIEQARDKYESMLYAIKESDLTYNQQIESQKQLEERNLEVLENLKAILKEKIDSNKKLQDVFFSKTVEIDNLGKECQKFADISNKVRETNTNLKKTIEELESKNKKLMESMNLNMFNRAAEYKQRTIKVLASTQLPQRIDKLRSSGYSLRYVLP